MKQLLVVTVAILALATWATAEDTKAVPTPSPSTEKAGRSFVDADGDGICDHFQTRDGKRGRGYGPGDGTGNQGVGPRDGSGYGPGSGSGNCDGTGPKGRGRGRRNRR